MLDIFQFQSKSNTCMYVLFHSGEAVHFWCECFLFFAHARYVLIEKLWKISIFEICFAVEVLQHRSAKGTPPMLPILSTQTYCRQWTFTWTEHKQKLKNYSIFYSYPAQNSAYILTLSTSVKNQLGPLYLVPKRKTKHTYTEFERFLPLHVRGIEFLINS